MVWEFTILQKTQCGKHSAIKDSRLTLKLWLKMKELRVTQPTFSDIVKRSGKEKSRLFSTQNINVHVRKEKAKEIWSFSNA